MGFKWTLKLSSQAGKIERAETQTIEAVHLREKLEPGQISVADLVYRLVPRISVGEDTVRAWAWFDAEHLREQASQPGAMRASGDGRNRSRSRLCFRQAARL